jgi:aminoglycoside/choline kinase family phosphotransferase
VSETASRAALEPRLEAFLAERYGVRASALEVELLSGDASARRYFRVKDGAATSVLALYPEPFETASSPFVAIRRLLANWGLPVPEILDHDGARGVLLLEDLGDVTLQAALPGASAGQRVAFYREALEQLARLQREATKSGGGAGCFEIAFDIEKLSWELHYFLKHFVEGLRGAQLTVADRSTLAEAFHRLSEEIAAWPRVLTHRDFHSRNLMPCDGRLFWIDFQDARMGPATYDAASLLRDAYVDLPEEFVAERLEEFRDKAAPGEARESFGRRFELMSAQRSLKALGTFGYMATVRRNPVYLHYIPRTLAQVRRNLARQPGLGDLRRVLARHIEELI